MYAYWIVNSKGELLSKQFSTKKDIVYLTPSILDGLGLTGLSNDFAVYSDNNSQNLSIKNNRVTMISCISDTPHCPKKFLLNLLGDEEIKYLGLRVGIEFEFFIEKLYSDKRKVTQSGEHAYKTSSYLEKIELFSEIDNTIKKLDVKKYCIHSEGASDQYEVSFGPIEPYEAALQYSLIKVSIESLCFQFGYKANFSAKPLEGHFGNGLHINFSFSNIDHKHSAELALSISQMSILLQSVYNPTHLSYARILDADLQNNWLEFDSWISAGMRTGIVRFVERDGRFEFRLPDTSSNIFNVLSSMIVSIKIRKFNQGFLPKKFNRDLLSSNLNDSVEKIETVSGVQKNALYGMAGLLGDEKYLGLKNID